VVDETGQGRGAPSRAIQKGPGPYRQEKNGDGKIFVHPGEQAAAASQPEKNRLQTRSEQEKKKNSAGIAAVAGRAGVRPLVLPSHEEKRGPNSIGVIG